MAVPAIHPGEHLAEELHALNMSAPELARKIKDRCANQSRHANSEWDTGCYGQHRSAPCSFLWHEGGVLAQSAESL